MKASILLLTALLLISSCSSGSVAGGSTTVENGYVAVTVAYHHTPVTAAVQLIPADYNPLTGENGPIRLIHSDETGSARFDSVPAGSYALLVQNDTVGRYESSIPLNTTVALALEKSGTVTITAEAAESIGITGTPFTGSVNAETGSVTFANIPAGTYSGVVTDSVQAITEITVVSEKVTEISVEQTQFSIQYIYRGGELVNFEVSDISRGSGDVLWAAADKGGLHRKSGDTWEFIGALHGLPSTEVINGVKSSRSVPAGARSEQVIAWGDQIYLYEDSTWYNLNSGNPHFAGRTVTGAGMSSTGTAVVAFSDQIYYNIRRSDTWIPVNIPGVVSLFCDSDTLWAGTESALYAIELTGTEAVQMTGSFGTIHAAGKTSDGVFFAASDSGLVKASDISPEPWQGTPKKLLFAASDESGSVWAVQGKEYILKFSSDGTIYRYHNPAIASSIRSMDGAAEGVIAAIGRNGIVTIK